MQFLLTVHPQSAASESGEVNVNVLVKILFSLVRTVESHVL
jgi:hypothetical protein